MDGVKTAIVGFIFVCIVLPHVIKNRHQYYLALAAVLLAMGFQAIGVMFGGGVERGALLRLCQTMDLLLQIVAILILVMAAGGLSARELAGNMGRAYEVMRRGEEEKEVIIPLGGQKPKSRVDDDDDDPLYDPKRYSINDPAPPRPPAGGAGEAKKEAGGAIPLD